MFEFNSNHSNDSGVNNMYPGILLINIIVLFISEPYAAPSTTINVTSEFDLFIILLDTFVLPSACSHIILCDIAYSL